MISMARDPQLHVWISDGRLMGRSPHGHPIGVGSGEARRDLRFLLTGSSARKLRQRGVNLLGGRARSRRLHPFVRAELKARDAAAAGKPTKHTITIRRKHRKLPT